MTPEYAAPDVPQIASPTTLSGGDFNPSAGATDTRTMLKEIFRHPKLVPAVIVLDPAVTTQTPRWLWLSSGVRALDHAVETVCPPAARLMFRSAWLERRSAAISLLAGGAAAHALQDPGRSAARLDAQLAVWLSMEHNRFGISMGASHGIGHVLGGTCNVPHGYTSCVMLPAVLRYNESVNADRQALVAEAFGRAGELRVARDRRIHRVVLAYRAVLPPSASRRINSKPSLCAALLDHYLHTNPRPIHGAGEIMDILRSAA